MQQHPDWLWLLIGVLVIGTVAVSDPRAAADGQGD